MWYNNKDVRLEEMPRPPIGPDEILVQVVASGICGSDGMEWYRLHKAPLVLGHEIAGVVAEAGSRVSAYPIGTRVSVAHHVPCNTCHFCLSGHHSCCPTLQSTNFFPGGFAEYVRVPAINVDRGVLALPGHVSFEEGTFVEPLGCVVRGLRQARLQPGQAVAVIGCGITAQLMIMAARAMGAGCIVASDSIPFRREMARLHGADAAMASDETLVEKIRELNDGRRADLVVICRPLVSLALDAVERGGTVLFFSGADDPKDTIGVPWNDIFWRTEVTLTSSYASPPQDSALALALIAAGRVAVRSMITHRLPLGEVGVGIDMLTHPWLHHSMKIIIECQT
ncbi:alcohol dehydrogenase catalytic domain-containing protein [Candidatus Fermentibacteria bacterium]|nr:alcohol dehydrogenase catalytic domain-containing protein [Candidatus Fermentibacteria bacterium]